MKVATKFILKISVEEEITLKQLWENSPSVQVRKRAHSILLSSEKYSIDNISNILDAHRDSVSSWLHAWESRGIVGLFDKSRSGAPSRCDEADTELVEQLLKIYPQSPKTILAKFIENTRKTISMSTLRRIIKKLDYRWKRVRKSVKHKRNVEEFEKAKIEIQALKKRQEAGEIDIVYFDEFGISLDPVVPYAYQPKGETIEILASRSKRLNTLGFFRTTDNHLESFCFEGNINSDIVIACFNHYCRNLDKRTFVMIDNASIHTSYEFEKNIPVWKEKNLTIKYLPAYSPELNLIEILWRFIKYKWLPFSAYLSFDALVNAIENILKNVGFEWIIDFA
jgi:transposase